MPTRYDRIPARIENPPEQDSDVVQIPLEDKQQTSWRNNRKKTTRRGLGSYESISGDDSDDDDDDEGDDQRRVENDSENTNRAPLHKQYSNDLDGTDESYRSLDEGTSPRSIYSSIRISDSFDLEDDDEDDVLEANLKRYNLDFSSTDNGDVLVHQGGNNDFRSLSSNHCCSRAAKYLWYSFQSVRQQARQRRAQLLLQQTERNWKQSLKICVLTNCDATDSGILLVATIMVLWILVLVVLEDPAVRRKGVLLGILCFAVRVGTRPLYTLFWKQRQNWLLRNQPPQQSNDDFLSSQSDGTLELQPLEGDHADPTVAAI